MDRSTFFDHICKTELLDFSPEDVSYLYRKAAPICKAGTFAQASNGDCTACAADEFSLAGSIACQKKTTIEFKGTCDKANPSFFQQFRDAFQNKIAELFNISKERVFLWEVTCPDGSMRQF